MGTSLASSFLAYGPLERAAPEWLRGTGPSGIELWQWLALALGAALAALIGYVLGWTTVKIFSRLAARTQASWYARMLARLRPPFAVCARDRMRLSCTISLAHATTLAQMRIVLEGIERTLRDHPRICEDVIVVRFTRFAASSLDIEVAAWFRTSDFGEFKLFCQELLLEFMQVIEQAGTSIAFPTRTIHLGSVHGAHSDRGRWQARRHRGEALEQ